MTSEWTDITHNVFPGDELNATDKFSEKDLLPHTIFLGPFPGEITPKRDLNTLQITLENLGHSTIFNPQSQELIASGPELRKSNRTAQVVYNKDGRIIETQVLKNQEMTHRNRYHYDSEGKLTYNESLIYRNGRRVRKVETKYYYPSDNRPIDDYATTVKYNNTKTFTFIPAIKRREIELKLFDQIINKK